MRASTESRRDKVQDSGIIPKEFARYSETISPGILHAVFSGSSLLRRVYVERICKIILQIISHSISHNELSINNYLK